MKFYNSGKYLHQVGRNKETGEMVESIKDLKPSGHDVGTAIVNFPGHGFNKPVKAGEWIELPDDLTVEIVKSACPALLTAEEAAPYLAAAAKPAVKGKE